MSETDSQTAPLDRLSFGRRLKGARILAGYDRMTDLASALEDECGLTVSARSLYAIERGEQMPTLEQTLCLVSLLSQDISDAFFLPSIREDVRVKVFGS